MDEQGGAGGIPRQEEQAQAQARQRDPHAERHGEEETTPAADTDEASRLDRPQQLRNRPQQPEKRPQQPEKPDGKGTRWVSPRDE
ncbi:hypothetical protein [Streptomyces subrutilus]|uniref:hypothetical protein n=1 Tax=Streptomyces subrutilus TaxID=36818 RepID=UPI0033F2D3C7